MTDQKKIKKCKIRYIISKIFLDPNKRRKIIKLWMSRKILHHDYKIVSSVFFGEESIILTEPELEYRALFKAIATLQYCVSVTINTITFFLDPTDVHPDCVDVSGKHSNGQQQQQQQQEDNKKYIHEITRLRLKCIFSFPLTMLGKEEMVMVNNMVKNDEFELVSNRCHGNDEVFCKFSSVKNIHTGIKTGDPVELEIKRVILNSIMDEIIAQASSDSIRISHTFYNKKYGHSLQKKSKQASSINDRDFEIINTSRLNIMYWLLSTVGYQLETVMCEVLDFSNIPSPEDFKIMYHQKFGKNSRRKYHGTSGQQMLVRLQHRVGVCVIYKNCLDTIKFIAASCETCIKRMKK